MFLHLFFLAKQGNYPQPVNDDGLRFAPGMGTQPRKLAISMVHSFGASRCTILVKCVLVP